MPGLFYLTAGYALVALAENVSVAAVREFPSDDDPASADTIVFFQRGSFADRRPAAMNAFLERGGSAVSIHWAVDGRDRAVEFSRRIGLAALGGSIGFRHGPVDRFNELVTPGARMSR